MIKGFIFFFLLLSPSALYAADPPNLPSSVTDDIGTQQEAFRKEAKAKPLEEEKKPKIESRIKDEKETGGPTTEFLVRKISVEESKVFSEKEIRKLMAPYENRTYTLENLREVARVITNRYRAKGYITSKVIIPPQRIAEDQVVFRVVEGKLGKVEVQGNRYFRKKMIRKEISTDSGEILNYNQLERDVLHINANVDREVKAVLLPGEIPETTDLLLQVKDRFPLHVGYHFDNLGTKQTGRNRMGVGFTDNNLLSLDDILVARFQATERGAFIGTNVDYVLPLNGSKTQIEFGYTHVNTKLGKEFEDLDVRGRANTFTTSFLQRLFDTDHWEGSFIGGFDFKEIETSVGGRDFTRDNLRVLRLASQLAEKDSRGRFFLTNEFHIGFSDFLGASDKEDKNASRPGATSQFFRYNVGAARLQRLWFSSFAILQATAQFTPDKLASVERYRLGGAETVRGYPEGEFIGDYGFLGRAELRFPFYFIPKDWKVPRTEDPLRNAFHFVGFCDYGQAFTKGASATDREKRTLAGVGGGIRVNLARRIVARIDWGYPVGSKPAEKETRLHFSLAIEL